MENTEKQPRKYNSKYSTLTEEERRLKYRENAKAWKQKVGNAKQYNYLHGHCDKCGRDYANIYEHNKSKKHQANANREIGVLNDIVLQIKEDPIDNECSE